MPESRTTKKSATARKSSQTKKRASRSKAKKPKVALARNKVILLSGIISVICVCALALSIIFNNIEEKPQTSAQTTQVAQIGQPQPQIPQESYQKKNDPSKEVSEKKVSSPMPMEKNAQTAKQATQKSTQVAAQPKKQEVAAKSQPAKSQKAESAAKNTQTAKATQPNKQTVTNTKASSVPKANAGEQNASQKSTKPTANSQIASSKKSAQEEKIQPSQNSHVASVTPPKQQEQIQQNVPKNRFDIPPAANGATIVIIIDDAGRSAENTKKYTSLPFPITIAVLPKLPQTRACADVIRASGQEMILHQPMQSMNLNLDPGPGKITETMSGYEIASIIKENLAELGAGVRGMNNHEGSLITSNVIKIGTVLDVCSEMGVYFLDSRTTAQTKAPQAALERDMHIFEKAGPYLDNEIDRAKMLERMRETLAYANRHGRAIVIGHVDKSVKILPDLLREMYPEMKAAGYRFATPSMLR